MTEPERRACIIQAVSRMQSDDYLGQGGIVWDALSSAERDVLKQLLFQGPVWDGNIVSKSARGDLFEYGLAVRCCFLGEQGYTAATYAAYSAFTEGRGKPISKKPGLPG